MKKILLFIAFALCVPGPSFAKTLSAESFGANIHLMQRFSQSEWSDVLDAAQQISVGSGREEFSWDVIEPSEGVFDWSVPDAVVAAYETAGIQMVGLLTYSSAWATTQEGNMHAVPELDAWGEYVRAVAQRYAGRVYAWEIWNEPNHSSFFSGTAAEYVDLIQIASNAIAEVDPEAQIVLGGLSGADTSFLREVLPHVETGSIDAIAIHPYRVIGDAFTYTPEHTEDGLNTLSADLLNVRAELERCGCAQIPVWLTEFGYPTHTTGLSEKQQARLLMRATTIALSSPNVTRVYWYSLVDAGDNENDQEDRFGLFTQSLEHKMSADAFAYLAQHLDGAEVKGVDVRVGTAPFEASALVWSTSNAVCATGEITRDSAVHIAYQFTESGNCYVPVETTYQLPADSRALLFSLSGVSDDTVLRLRVIDATGETLQYTLARMPHKRAWHRVDFLMTTTHWGGNNDGVPDGTLTLNSVVLDNSDGAPYAGEVTIHKMQVSTGAYAYRFSRDGARRVMYWAPRKTQFQYRFSRARRIRVQRFLNTHIEKEGTMPLLTATHMPKIFSVLQ